MLKTDKPCNLSSDQILIFLSIKDLAILSKVNKSLYQYIKSQKLLKKSLYFSDLLDSTRLHLWKQMSNFKEHKEEILKTHTSYQLLLEKAKTLTSVKERVVKDLHRTHLVSTDQAKQESLCNILLCVAYLFPGISYCQGMNCVAAALLLVLSDEEDCMFMFVSIIQEWPLAKVYEPGLPDLLLREYQFNSYFKRLLPDLHSHFKNEDVTTGFFMSRWYLTIFSIYLPFEICIHIWDCIFHSKWKSIIKVSLSLMIELKPKLVSMDKAHISSLLRDSMRDFSCNYKQVLRQAWSIKVTNSALEDLAQDFYIQVANYKLKNIEPYFTEEENTALYETKLKLAEHSEENNRLIQGLQKNIEDQGKKIEDLVREARDMASQMHELENLIENQCDKKSAYVKTLSELQGKVGDGSGIYESDLNIIQEKINDIDFTLKEMKNEYIDKDIAYKIVKDSLFKCLSIKERHSKLLLGYISQNETEKQGILLQLSKKLSPISLS